MIQPIVDLLDECMTLCGEPN